MELRLRSEHYQDLQQLYTQAQQGQSAQLANQIGVALAHVGTDLIDDLFEGIHQKLAESEHYESAETIAQVKQRIHKYLPWAVKYLSHQRLMRLLAYFIEQAQLEDGQVKLRYSVPDELYRRFRQQILHIEVGDARFMPQAFATLTEILDLAVNQWVRQPKASLELNALVNKTMDGVIHVTTQIGYQRLSQLGQELDPKIGLKYLQHFLEFLHQKP